MSKITDDFTALTANLTTIQGGIVSLDSQIQALQTSLSTSNLSPADQAALDQIVATSGNLATAATAVVTAPTTPVSPVVPAAPTS